MTKIKPTIFLDMDGTIADLYGVPDWLPKLQKSDPSPYRQALPKLNMRVLSRTLNQLIAEGYKISIISWLSKNSTADYDEAVKNAKLKWIKKHLGAVTFTDIHIVKYGTPKTSFATAPCILFDDEIKNRYEWRAKFGNTAYDQKDIIKTLKKIITEIGD